MSNSVFPYSLTSTHWIEVYQTSDIGIYLTAVKIIFGEPSQNLAFLCYAIIQLILYIYSVYSQGPEFTSANDSLL